jgi:hypothetical protein
MKRLEMHGMGIHFFKSSLGEEECFHVLLDLCEIIFDRISVDEQEYVDFDLETQNPLQSSTQIALFDRLWSELLSLSILDSETQFNTAVKTRFNLV